MVGGPATVTPDTTRSWPGARSGPMAAGVLPSALRALRRPERRGSTAPSAATRLRVLEALTVLVPAVCAGIYETARHSFLANQFSNSVGTAVAVAIVLGLSYTFARASFGIIHRMEARLVERNRRLEVLSQDARRVATLEERERLAREIHDGVAQVIATLLVRVDTIESLIARGRTAEAATELRDLRASGDLANVEVREAIAGLRANPLPGALGLADALRRYVEDFGARTGIDATFHSRVPLSSATAPSRSAGIAVDPSPLRSSSGDLTDAELPPGHELHLMRVAIEALTNVRKHAHARTVSVTLTSVGERVPVLSGSPQSSLATGGWSLQIADDGVGFDPEIVASGLAPESSIAPRRRHFGLAMMRERVTALGGTCAVTSSPGEGTTIRVVVPWSDRTPGDDDGEYPGE